MSTLKPFAAKPMTAEQESAYRAWAGQPERRPDVRLSAPGAWSWGWSPWIGIHYGPVPVGVLAVFAYLMMRRM